jgi:tetratricopeptide (TPR) repeat protein
LNASVAAGVNKFYLGQFAAAHRFLERALELDTRGRNPQQIPTYGQDMGSAARGFLAWTLAVTGDLDAAACEAGRALRSARELDHPFSLALVLLTAAEVHQLRRDPATVAVLGHELLALAREHAFAFFTAFGLMFTGWARAASEDRPGGLALMREGASLFQDVGQRLGLAHRAHLAEAMIADRLFDEGRDIAEEALRRSVETGEGAFVAELNRLRAEAFHGLARLDEAVASAREALAVATAQGAGLFALRAASTLVRLGAERGSVASADVDALSTIVNGFPPAFESSDLAAARGLLNGARR